MHGENFGKYALEHILTWTEFKAKGYGREKIREKEIFLERSREKSTH